MRASMFSHQGFVPLAVSVCFVSVGSADPLSFSEEAIARGVNFSIAFNYAQYGSGMALVDLDNDGDLDIVVSAGSSFGIGVYENDGSGFFTNRSLTSGITNMNLSSGMAAADYDNDGDIDIYMSGWYTNSRLYRNNGDFTFTDVAVDAGIIDPSQPNMAASWGDVNLDGHLDLYVSVRTGHNAYTGSNHLYMNNGDGTFSDEAINLNIDAEVDPTLLSAFFDFDRDGDDDLYLGTDKGSGGTWMNRLYRNDGGSFTEVTTQANAQAHVDCMGIAVGDIDFDGFYDMYLTNIQHGNKLFKYNPVSQAYVDYTLDAGVGSYRIGWGTFFEDFDNDTELDLYVCNMQGDNRLYRGSQTWPLIDEAPTAGVGEATDVFCAAQGDIDGDGDIDMIVGATNGKLNMYINNSADAASNNWARFNVVGNTGELNQFAIGACVDIEHDGKSQVRQVRAGTNYKTTSAYTLHFGLGDSDMIGEMDVIYPGNSEIRHFTNVPANRVWTLYPSNMLGDRDGNGRIDHYELYEAILARTGPGNPIEPGLEIYDMDGDFDLDNDDLALMDLNVAQPPRKFNGVRVGP